MITNRKETKSWLWEYLINQTIKNRNLVGEEESKFRRKPDQNWLKETADRLLPNCDLDNFPPLHLGHPPMKKPNYDQYSKTRANKKPKH